MVSRSKIVPRGPAIRPVCRIRPKVGSRSNALAFDVSVRGQYTGDRNPVRDDGSGAGTGRSPVPKGGGRGLQILDSVPEKYRKCREQYYNYIVISCSYDFCCTHIGHLDCRIIYPHPWQKAPGESTIRYSLCMGVGARKIQGSISGKAVNTLFLRSGTWPDPASGEPRCDPGQGIDTSSRCSRPNGTSFTRKP